jgi:hypothetical protein
MKNIQIKVLILAGTLLVIILAVILAISSGYLHPRLGDQTKKSWSINRGDLQALIAETNQVKSEPFRLLQTIDRLEFQSSGGLKVYGTCFSGGTIQDGDFRIALNNQNSRVNLEINVGNTCGITQDDPRIAVMNNELSNALGEKIVADCGKVLVDWIELSGNRLTIWYVKP